jgi:hypothetical protein
MNLGRNWLACHVWQVTESSSSSSSSAAASSSSSRTKALNAALANRYTLFSC